VLQLQDNLAGGIPTDAVSVPLQRGNDDTGGGNFKQLFLTLKKDNASHSMIETFIEYFQLRIFLDQIQSAKLGRKFG